MNINEVILTVMIAGFGFNFALILLMWRTLNARIDVLDKRIDKLSEIVLDIDRRLCRIEGALSSKECCMLKDESKLKKVE